MSRNNETTTKFKVDISELQKSMQEAKRQVAITNSEFKAVSSTMDDWSKSSDGISAKLKQLGSNLESQKNILSNYEKQLELTMKQYPKGGKAVDDLIIKINDQKAVVNKIEKEMANYEDTLKEVSEAERIASKTGKDVSEVLDDMHKKTEETGDGFTVLKGAVAEFVGNALTKLVDGLKNGISSLVTFADEADKAMNSFQASTGATAEEMAEFEDVMKNIYNGNYGESFEDIATAMGDVKRIAGDIGADELEKMTTNAMTLRDTFDFEVSESMRAVNSLMDQFGVTSDEAFNLMAQGAQSGLNQNGDLLDVINEYSVHFERAGYSAEDMFNMLANGVEAGTWSVDKLGDAFKEFNIRMSDGSAKDAVEALGFSWEKVSESWSAGGDDAKDVFNMLINEMDGMEDSVDGYGIGVGLLGTMFEDLGYDALYALSQVDGEITKTKDTLGEINAVKYDSVGEALQGIGRNLQTGILMPIGEKLIPIVSDLAAKFQEWLNDPATQEGLKTFTDSVAEFVDNGLVAIKDGVQWFLDNKDSVIAGLVAIATGFTAFKVAGLITTVVDKVKSLGSAIAVLQTIMTALGGPVTIAIAVIAGLVAGFITLWKTSDEFRAFWINLWENVKSVTSTVVSSISNFFAETIPQAISKAFEWFGQIPSKVADFVDKTKTKFTEWRDNMVETIVNFFSELPNKIGYALGFALTKVALWLADTYSKVKTEIPNIINSIVTFFSGLPNKIWTWLVNVVTKVTTWINNMKTKAVEFGTSFINTVVTYISQLPDKIKTWLDKAITNLSTWVDDMKTKGKDAIKGLIDNVIEGASSIPEKMAGIGKNIVDGVWAGIKNAKDQFFSNVKGFFSGLVEGAKDALGIESPSKVFAREVGKWIPAGIAVGIDKNAKTALNSVRDLALNTVGSARAGLSTGTTTLGGSSVGAGVVNNFTQVINSPKQLSRLDIYRQSKNLLGYAGGGI